MQDTTILMQRIQALPPERIAEVADFVDFLATREQERSVIRAAASASAAVFAEIWDNSDDADYDVL